MPFSELRTWQLYIAEHGTLNLGVRLDAGLRYLAALIINRTGGDNGRLVDPSELMRRVLTSDEDEPSGPPSILDDPQAMFAQISAMAKRNNAVAEKTGRKPRPRKGAH